MVYKALEVLERLTGKTEHVEPVRQVAERIVDEGLELLGADGKEPGEEP